MHVDIGAAERELMARGHSEMDAVAAVKSLRDEASRSDGIIAYGNGTLFEDIIDIHVIARLAGLKFGYNQ